MQRLKEKVAAVRSSALAIPQEIARGLISDLDQTITKCIKCRDQKLNFLEFSHEKVSDDDKETIQGTFTGAENITLVDLILTIDGTKTQDYEGELIIASFDGQYDILKAGGYVYSWSDVLGTFDKI